MYVDVIYDQDIVSVIDQQLTITYLQQ